MYVEKKKKKPIVMIIFLLLILGVLAYFGVQYYLQQNEKKEEKKPPKVEEKVTVPLTENEQAYLLEKISFYDGMLPYDSFDATTLSREKAFQMIESIKDKEYVDFTRGVTVKRIDEILKRYFGPNASIGDVDTTCQDPASCYFYEEEKKGYVKTSPTVVSNIATKNIYIEGTKEKNKNEIVIKVRQLYYQKEPMNPYIARFFRTAEEASSNQNPIFDLTTYGNALYNSRDYPNYLNQAIESVKDQISVATYTFQYQAGGYYLESVVK